MSVHQDLYQELIKLFTNFISKNVKPNILNEEDLGLYIVEKVEVRNCENQTQS